MTSWSRDPSRLLLTRPARPTMRRRLLAAAAATSMVASLLSAAPVYAKPAKPATPKAPPAEKLDNVGGTVTGKAWTPPRVKDSPVPQAVWPSAGSTRVDLAADATRSARGVRAANMPVWVDRAAGKSGASVSSVDISVLDRSGLPAAWRDGVVMKVTTPAGAPSGAAKVSVDYSGFRYAGGADWASRLRLWQVPECALSTPDVPGCRSQMLPTVNDSKAGIATADVTVAAAQPSAYATSKAQLAGNAASGGTGMLVVLAAAASGSDGDFGATGFASSSTWSAGGSSGDFTWSYPIRVPPAAAGPAPAISLGYASSAVDGRSEVTNNQPSWIGEGFEYSPGYIERRYVSCSEDMKNGANNTEKTGDQCWRSDNATMNLNGAGGELVYEAGKGWHSRSEDGSKIEKLTGAAGNGDNDGEYWKVTTTDGTQYFFGLHNLPGQTAKTNSTLSVPVFGNHTGEPCHQTTFAGSDCVQAWRWNLDYVVDVRGNTVSYWYNRETNKYARNITDSDDVTYDRGGYLTRADYGTYDRTLAEHGVTERSTTPYAQVLFDTDMRCFTSCGTEANPTVANWKDTPWDQECKDSATSCPQQYTPTFWTTKRLKKITTRVWDITKPTPAWQDVESWTFSHTFNATADSTHTGLWLDRLDHAGLVGGTVNMPPVTFSAVSLQNRVYTSHGTTDNWLRISDIKTEAGALIHVDYSLPECTEANTVSLQPHTNTLRCYPVLIPDPDDPDNKLVTEWWHKYVVTQVTENDIQLNNGQSPAKQTRYEYVGTPAWHYADDDGLSKPDRKTWAQWRGYGQVKMRVGDNPATQSLTVSTFLRGMHGDKAAPSGGTRTVTIPASLGSETVYDEDQFAGMVREAVVYNGVETKPVSKTVNVPWRSAPTASRTINGDTVEARFVKNQTTYSSTALGVDGSRGWRTSRTTSNFDDTYGTTNWTQNDGDIAVANDEQCISSSYNRNTVKNIVTTPKQTTTTALACGQTPATVNDIISDVRVYYDGASSVTTAPVYGSVTKTEQLKDWTAGTGTVWQVASQASFDASGRAISKTDIRGNTSTTVYTPTVGGPAIKATAMGPAPYNWTTSVETSPYWSAATKSTDQNGKVTSELAYDPLGRLSGVWKQGWDRATNPTTPSVRYTYWFAPNRDAYPYIKTEALNADGNYVTSYQFLDGLLRQRQTQMPSMSGDGNRIVADTMYDELGRVATAYAAHAEPGAPSGTPWWEPSWSVPTVTRTDYDSASRPIASVFLAGDGVTNLVEKWRSTTAYEGDLTKITPPRGGIATTTEVDIKGRSVGLRQHTTASGVGGAYQETRYVYNRKDQLVTTTDPAGNQWITDYDVKGRVWRTTDPDKGVSTNTYNDIDDLTTTKDARNEVLWYGYDALGRKTQLRDDSSTGALRAEWKYDTLYSGQGGYRGQLTQSIRYEPPGVTANAYKWQVRTFDERYQPTGVNYVIPAVETGLNQTYIFGYGYAGATGQPLSIAYPAGGGLVNETITTDYQATTGLPVSIDTSLTGFTGTMATTSYTAFGERNGSIYKMPGGVYVQDIVYRDEATRRVTRTTFERQTIAGTVADRNYSYDEAGNIESIGDTPQIGSADTQCFRYDKLAQLTTAWTPKTGVDCNTNPTVANLGGPAPYWTDWSIDSTASRRTETSHAAAGNTTRSYTVPTGGAGVVRPHAVTQMNTSAPGQGTVVNTYGYDPAGNTTCRPTATTANTCSTGSGSQTLTWDAEGHLSTVAAAGTTTETNIYDANGTRIIRRDATGTTLYLPGQEIRRTSTTTTGTRYYSLAGAVCGSRTGSSAMTDLTWLSPDHQGTQQVAINASTQAVSIRRQTPYGSPRGTNPAWVNNKGFVGGDNDPTNLVNIGARQYDPLLGRFISVDPILAADDPAQYNAYQYAANSPIAKSDPTGTMVLGDGGSTSNRNSGSGDGSGGGPKTAPCGGKPGRCGNPVVEVVIVIYSNGTIAYSAGGHSYVNGVDVTSVLLSPLRQGKPSISLHEFAGAYDGYLGAYPPGEEWDRYSEEFIPMAMMQMQNEGALPCKGYCNIELHRRFDSNFINSEGMPMIPFSPNAGGKGGTAAGASGIFAGIFGRNRKPTLAQRDAQMRNDRVPIKLGDLEGYKTPDWGMVDGRKSNQKINEIGALDDKELLLSINNPKGIGGSIEIDIESREIINGNHRIRYALDRMSVDNEILNPGTDIFVLK